MARTGNFVIPESVITVGNAAFSRSNIDGVVFGSNIEEIKDGAFNKCVNLKNITLPKTLKIIGNNALTFNEFEVIVIPENVNFIGSGAFAYSEKLKTITIPDSVNSIGAGAFLECRSLTRITIPDNITDIKTKLFYKCYNLKTVIVGKDVSIIEEDAFSNCCNLKEVIFLGDNPRLVGSNFFNRTPPCATTALTTVYISSDSKGFDSTFSVEKLPVAVLGTVDTDGDGVFDDDDKFPNDPNETVDSDGDGVGDNADAFPNYKGETADSDGDGVGDNAQSSIAKTAEINTLKAQLASANSTIAEKDQEIARLSNSGITLEQVQDGRLGSVVLTPIPNTNMAILSLDIEQSNDLKTWTLYRNILESIPLPEGKKFYRFALDKSAQREIDNPIVIDPPIDPPIEF